MEELAMLAVYVGLVCLALFGLFCLGCLIWGIRARRESAGTPAPVPWVARPDGPPMFEGRPLTTLPPHREVFSRKPLEAGRIYAVIVEGTFTYFERTRDTVGAPVAADAQYCTDPGGHNFLLEWNRLAWSGHRKPTLFAADRHLHRYVFTHVGEGSKLSLIFNAPPRERLTTWDVWLTIRDPSPEMVRAEHALVARREAEQEAEQHAAVRRRQEELSRRVYETRVKVAPLNALSDEAILKEYGRANAADLIKRERQILEEHLELHRDPEFVRLLKETDPVAYQRSLFRTRALNHAYRSTYGGYPSRQSRSHTDDARTARPKPTTDEVRDRIVKGFRTRWRDRMAVQREQREIIRDIEAEIRRLNPGIDDDDFEREFQKFQDAVFTEESTNGRHERL